MSAALLFIAKNKEVDKVATTRIIPMHINKGKTILQCFTDRIDYVLNPDKTDNGNLVSSYKCDSYFGNYEEFTKYVKTKQERYTELSGSIKATEKRLTEIAVLKKHIINYSKTRDVYVGYRKSGYSKKYLAEHEADIIIHKAAKKAFDELQLEKLPAIKSLNAEYAKLLSKKKSEYAKYVTLKNEIKEMLLHKQNYEFILGIAPDKNERNEHDRNMQK